MSKESNLLKSTGIYAIGSFGSKLLSYVMVMIYSYFINPEELGYYDLIMTSTAMLQPILILGINEGIYRFIVTANNNDRGIIIGTGLKFVLISMSVSEILFFVLSWRYSLRYGWEIAIYFFSLVIYITLQEIVRGVGNNKLYASIGLVNSVIMLVAELLLIVALKLGVQALIYSKIMANLVAIILMFLFQKEVRKVLVYKFDKEILRKLLAYSMPLIPNIVCWWVINSSDRYIILGYLDKEQNGIYMIANKFPTIITAFTSVFYLAWQETALKEYNTPNRDSFFNKIFDKYSTLLLSLCVCAIPATKILFRFVGEAYVDAWKYTGFLYVAVVFSSLSSFLGLGYQISKETKRSVYTSVIAAAINIGVNIALICKWGLQAASFSTFCAFFILFIIRIYHTKRYFALKISWLKICLLLLASGLMMLATIFVEQVGLLVTVSVATVVMFFIVNKSIWGEFINKVFRKRK